MWFGRSAHRLAALGALMPGVAATTTIGAESNADNPLAGVIDFHCHSGPDVVARSLNDLELVRLARDSGLRGIVLKNHHTATTDRAQLAMQEIGGIEVFGGVALNLAVGGINADAVRRMLQFEGQRGRIVWLPTLDAEYQVTSAGEDRPFVAVVRDGRPVPPLMEVYGRRGADHTEVQNDVTWTWVPSVILNRSEISAGGARS